MWRQTTLKQGEGLHAPGSRCERGAFKHFANPSTTCAIDVPDTAYRDVRVVWSPFGVVAKDREADGELPIRLVQGIRAFGHSQPKNSRRPRGWKRSCTPYRQTERVNGPGRAHRVGHTTCRVLFQLAEKPEGDMEVLIRDPADAHLARRGELTLKVADGVSARSSLGLVELNTNEQPHGQPDTGSFCPSCRRTISSAAWLA